METRNLLILVSLCLIVSVGNFAYVWVQVGSLISTTSSLAEDVADMKETLNDLAGITEFDRLVQAARKEGKVVFWTSWTVDYVSALCDAFKETYPWMTVEWYRAGSGAVWDKYTQEVEAGKVTADVMGIGDIPLSLKMKENGWMLFYNSSFYDYYPESFQDRGYWCAWRLSDKPLVYNTELVDFPVTSYWDLLKPEFKGKIAVENPTQGGGETMAFWSIWQVLGIEYWEQLRAQDILWLDSGGAVMEAIVSGQVWATTTSYGYRYLEYYEKTGGKIAAGYDLEVVPTSPCAGSITAQTTRPNAAKLFMEWLFSYEGQKVVTDQGQYSIRKDGPVNPLMPPIAEISAWPPDMSYFDDYFANYEAILQEANRIVTG